MSVNLKYRPTKMKDVVGNEETLASLSQYLGGIKSGEKSRRTILITGDSGCGKTTIARLIGKELGAFDYKSEVNLDFIEINASGDGGKDMTKAVQKQMVYAPMKGQFKIFFMDECHKLSPAAQEALLKPLEEPPAHVVFIFATTNPEKLKVTFKRRCATFKMAPTTDEDLLDLLEHVVKKEKKKVPESILASICEVSICSPGVALGILDTVIDLPKKQMKAKIEQHKETKEDAIELCRALMKKKSWKDISVILLRLKAQNEEPEGIRRLMLGYCQSCLLRGDDKMYVVMDAFREPTYNNGFAEIVLSAFEARMD